MKDELKKKIEALKSAGHSVFQTTVAGKTVIYRTLKRVEFKKLQAAASVAAKDAGEDEAKLAAIVEDNKEQLVVLCLVDPVVESVFDLSDLPAGIVDTLSDAIMTSSGFGMDAQPTQL